MTHLVEQVQKVSRKALQTINLIIGEVVASKDWNTFVILIQLLFPEAINTLVFLFLESVAVQVLRVVDANVVYSRLVKEVVFIAFFAPVWDRVYLAPLDVADHALCI